MKLFGLLAASAAAFTRPFQPSAGERLCDKRTITAMADFTNGFHLETEGAVTGQIFFKQDSCSGDVEITGSVNIAGKFETRKSFKGTFRVLNRTLRHFEAP